MQVCPGSASPRTLSPYGSCGTVNFHTNARTSNLVQRPESHVEFVTRMVGSGLGAVFDSQATRMLRLQSPAIATVRRVAMYRHSARFRLAKYPTFQFVIQNYIDAATPDSIAEPYRPIGP